MEKNYGATLSDENVRLPRRRLNWDVSLQNINKKQEIVSQKV